MELGALTWNLFHGRDYPPDPALFTWRSRLLRRTERDFAHLQVNRDLGDEFAAMIAAADWDVALLQECPPRWSASLADACGASGHATPTSRNSLGWLRETLARFNPDLIASNEGGSNLTLVRGQILDRRELVLTAGPRPERRVMVFTHAKLIVGGPSGATEVCIANLHASAGRGRRGEAEREVLTAAGHACEWAGDTPLIFGGDLNLRPAETNVFTVLDQRHGLTGATAPDVLDHLLTHGLEPLVPPAPWPPERREVRSGGLAIRLSDHAPVEARFTT
jgi:endonuclease/exonuclease/phosphatase family metal-dependent hydrolase